MITAMSDYKLKQLVWELTMSCCFNCKYCGSGGGQHRDNELITSECLDVADQLIELGVERVNLIGGEVFMRPDWDIIAKRLTSAGVKVTIITNGWLFNSEVIQRIKDAGIKALGISLDGPKDIHDKYRQTGSYDRAIKAIDDLTAAVLKVAVISTLNSENVQRLDELYNILKTKKIYTWQLQACSPMGNAANSGIPFEINHSDVMRFIVDKNKKTVRNKNKFIIVAADNIGYFDDDEVFVRGSLTGQRFYSGCMAGISSIGIDSVGNVKGCESMQDPRFNEGNLREKTLKEIWENPQGFSYNRQFNIDKLTGKCNNCEFGRVCRGGCRSYNYFVTGGLYEHPYCAKRQ